MKPQQAAISVLIVVVLGMQGLAFFTGTRFYPFVDYPMYRRAYGPPVEAVMYGMHAELLDGRRIDVTAEYLGLKRFAWEDVTVKRILAEPGDGPRAALIAEHRSEALERVTAAVRQREGVEPVALHFTIQTHRIVPGGIEREDAERVVPLAAPDGAVIDRSPDTDEPDDE